MVDVGHITIVDYDSVELSNLKRQVLYWEANIGEKISPLVVQKLSELNLSIELIPVFQRITEDNIRVIIKGAHVVIDGRDNFETRFILNSACVAERILFIHARVHGALGEVTAIIPGETSCLGSYFFWHLQRTTGDSSFRRKSSFDGYLTGYGND
jgi:adenylyltransferase/sulfurtransferase